MLVVIGRHLRVFTWLFTVCLFAGAIITALAFSPVSQASAPLVTGIANLPGDCSMLPPLPHVTAVRVNLAVYEPLVDELACATTVHSAGYRLLISVQYTNTWSLARDRRWFTAAAQMYAPLDPYSISVGNEQGLSRHHPRSATPAHYDRVWRAVEPIIADHDPQALRVAGEITPWGLAWFRQVVIDGLPGAQVYSAHVYPVTSGYSPRAFVALARTHHVRAWATEGMCGPDAWMRYGCRTRAAIRAEGFSLALEWYGPVAIVSTPAH
jgi:hypothetical protein